MNPWSRFMESPHSHWVLVTAGAATGILIGWGISLLLI